MGPRPYESVAATRRGAGQVGLQGVFLQLLPIQRRDRAHGFLLCGLPQPCGLVLGAHEDPKQGVVDADCKVLGLGNLYVAGDSVNPTSGAANPTLTPIALTLRLSDRLKSRMA